MLSKAVLGISGLIFTLYGLACLFQPELLTHYAGLAFISGDAAIEISAMYGGLQAGFGLLCLLGAMSPAYTRFALLAMVFGIGGIAVGRAIGLLISPEVPGDYTWGALIYETLTVSLAFWCWRATRDTQAPA